MRAIKFLSILAALAAFGPNAHAQAVKGTLLGAVLDSSGAAIPSAKLVIVDINRGLTREAVTNDSGLYSFPNLEAGAYRVTVEVAGFQKAQRESVEVLVNSMSLLQN